MTASSPTGSKRMLALVAGFVVFTILIGLGTWQVFRMQWKEQLLATIAERQAMAPVGVADLEWHLNRKTLPNVDYYPIRVTGEFLHTGERHFFATWKGETGYYIYTPLRLTDGRFVFVNRGFVPYDLKDPAKRMAGQVSGQVTITGVARNILVAKPSWLVPDNDLVKNIFYWKDYRAMRQTAGLPADARVLTFFIDANDAPNPGGLPAGGVTMVDLPNNHLQYVITWYGLAAALVAVLGVWLWRGRA